MKKFLIGALLLNSMYCWAETLTPISPNWGAIDEVRPGIYVWTYTPTDEICSSQTKLKLDITPSGSGKNVITGARIETYGVLAPVPGCAGGTKIGSLDIMEALKVATLQVPNAELDKSRFTLSLPSVKRGIYESAVESAIERPSP